MSLHRRVAILAAACSFLAGLGGLGASAALAAAPPNDGFAAAKVVGGKAVESAGTTVGATPSPCFSDPDVWYRWRAPESGPVRAAIEGAGGEAPVFKAWTGANECSLSEAPEADLWDSGVAACGGFDLDPRRVCEAFEAEAGRTYDLRVAAVYDDTIAPFTLRLVEDNLAPETALEKVKWGPHNRFRQRRKSARIKVRARATDPEPSVEPVFLRCRFAHKGQSETCDHEWGTDSSKLLPWKAAGSPVGKFTARKSVEITGVDGLLNSDPTPLDLRLKVKARCIGGGVGGKECWIRRVKVRR
jgi:hypothetical protein